MRLNYDHDANVSQMLCKCFTNEVHCCGDRIVLPIKAPHTIAKEQKMNSCVWCVCVRITTATPQCGLQMQCGGVHTVLRKYIEHW